VNVGAGGACPINKASFVWKAAERRQVSCGSASGGPYNTQSASKKNSVAAKTFLTKGTWFCVLQDSNEVKAILE
jgi:hypothetical protein